MNRFEELNPAVLFGYFFLVLIPVMFVTDLGLSLCALICGVIYYIVLRKHFPAGLIGGMLLVTIVIIVIDVFVLPAGERVLFYAANKAVTAEAVMTGVSTGLMLCAVSVWYADFNAVFSSDMIISALWPFPRTGLLISMILKLVPEYAKRYQKVQTINGIDSVKGHIKVSKAVFSWALERSMDTADSMMMRGYPHKRRARAGRVRGADIYILIGAAAYIPAFFIQSDIRLIICGIFFLLPVIYRIKENIRWAIYESRN